MLRTVNPLKVILPVGPGTGVDVIVCAAQAALSKALNDQAAVIENIAGAGGITGTAALVKAAPDGNTIAEQGFTDVDVSGWFAVIGPAKMPAAQITRIHEAVVAAFNDPSVKAAMAKQDNIITPTSPQVATQYLKTEQERYAKLVTKANVKLD